MAEVDELFERVLKESGKSTEEIRGMIDKRKAATHGLLSDYGALYAVAKELGVESVGDKLTTTKLSDVKPKGSYNVAGRVAAVYPPKDFNKKDGGTGKIASVFLSDGSGEARLVLWDSNADYALRAKVGDAILARNVYGKEGLRGNVELQAGNMSNVLINPKINLDLPDLRREMVKAGSLQTNMNGVSIVLRVVSVYPPATFTRPDGKEGIRASLTGEDDTGSIRVVLWGEAAKTKLDRGDIVKIDNAYTKEGFKGGLELHVGGRASIEKTDEKLDLAPLESMKDAKVKDVKADMQNLSLTARIVRLYEPRTYSNGVMASMVVGDETGTIRVVVWNDKASTVSELKRGDTIKIKNAYTKANLQTEPEIHIGRYSEIIQSQDAAAEMPSISEIENSMTTEKKIIDLQNNERYVRIKGAVVGVDENRGLMYTTCSNCNRKVQNIGEMWFCESCNENVEPQQNLKVSVVIEDETGSVRAVAFKENAEKIIGMDIEEIMNLIGETGDEQEPVKRMKESLGEKPVSLVGRVRYSDFSDQLEFIVEDVEAAKEKKKK